MSQPTNAVYEQIQQHIEVYARYFDVLQESISQVIVGQKYTIRGLLIGLLAQGHILLEGLPGLAKTLAAHTMASALSLHFQRIQFTPDLLPADLIGTLIYQQAEKRFSPKFGPIFANVVLADEINRAPAKVQSALLEAMQEQQITLGDRSYPLPKPFWVLATQNPVEQEGTYDLPEAQIDRFMLKLLITYPSRDEERLIMERMIDAPPPPPRPVLSGEQILNAQQLLAQIYVSDSVKNYILDIVHATRPTANAHNPERSQREIKDVQSYIDYGVSPRAMLALNRAARASAMLSHRYFVIPDDVKTVVYDVLRHRLGLSYRAEADGLTPDDIIRQILMAVEIK